MLREDVKKMQEIRSRLIQKTLEEVIDCNFSFQSSTEKFDVLLKASNILVTLEKNQHQ